MAWYLAKMVFQIVCGEGKHTPQFDEQLRLIMATDRSSAIEKARKMGLQEQDCFYNQQQKMVQWNFIDIAEIFCLQSQSDGAEISCRIVETVQPELYIQQLHTKAAQLNNYVEF